MLEFCFQPLRSHEISGIPAHEECNLFRPGHDDCGIVIVYTEVSCEYLAELNKKDGTEEEVAG